MYFFIAIVFIAELIITTSLINAIWKADKAVRRANEMVVKLTPQIYDGLNKFKKNVHSLEKSVSNAIAYFRKKREEYTIRIIKKILLYLLILIIETRFSKIYKLKKWTAFGKPLLKRFLA